MHYALHVHAAVQRRKCAFENQKCKMHFWFLATSRKKCPPRCAWDQVRILQSWFSWEVTAKCAATSPCWCRTFWPPPIRTTFCHSDSGQRQNDADQSQTDTLSVTWPTNCRSRCQLSNLTSRFYLAFLQFFREWRSNLALSPYFCASGRFDRILEIGEQTGSLKEIFKNFLRMVPLCPRFFSYKWRDDLDAVKTIVLSR